MKTKKRNFSDLSLDLLKVLFLAFAVIICLYPFWNIFIVSINDANDAMRGGLYLLPRKLSLSSYADILGRSTFQHSILVTVARTLIGTPLAVLVTSALAYVLSYRDLIGRKPLNVLFIFTMYFGGGMVPYYMVLKNLGLLDNFLVFILPNLLSVYNMILVRNYIESMPEALFDAARIDGANDLTIFFRLVLPLSALFGGAFLMLAELVSRTIMAPAIIPVGAVTALVGAPFFALVFFRGRKLK